MIEMADSEKDLGVQISVAWYSGTLRNSQPRSQSAAHIGPSFHSQLNGPVELGCSLHRCRADEMAPA